MQRSVIIDRDVQHWPNKTPHARCRLTTVNPVYLIQVKQFAGGPVVINNKNLGMARIHPNIDSLRASIARRIGLRELFCKKIFNLADVH